MLQLLYEFGHFDWNGPVGCGFPAAIQHGIARTAANLSDEFIDTNIDHLFSEMTGCPCYCLNDADAAGIAEMNFGAGTGESGVVLLVTIGTGLGTVFFTDGVLLPNSELGHVYMDNGKEGEHFASDTVRKAEELGWKSWGKRLNKYLSYMEALFWPDLIILGGGASKKFDKFSSLLTLKARVKPAQLLNQAGIVGAALYARSKHK
ncbi:ROK family protein [Methyloprofundus sedimenti]|uniref:ROK family protein n=1 Tax=Methyloprofundus sedimenti TaxID=1420851 RepID=UPI0009B6A43C|nr:ROK family protein [Methyloprofundus sedimenti]